MFSSFESLENRRLFAVTASFTSGTGILTIFGDSLDNSIVVSRDAGASFGRIARELTTEAFLSPTGLPTWHESTVRRAYERIGFFDWSAPAPANGTPVAASPAR